MEIVIGWIVFSILAGFIASEKGRSGPGFFLLSLILSPLFGVLAAIFAARREVDKTETPLTIRNGRAVRMETSKPCPFCAETIKIEAVVCKHCGRDLSGSHLADDQSHSAPPPSLHAEQPRNH